MPNIKHIRVCQVLHGIVGGGSEQVVLNYCSRMRDIHFDLLYQYEPNPLILERFNEAGINCIQIPDKVHHPLKHLWKMFNIFRKGRYDVIHSHLDWYLNSCVCFLAMLAGVKKRIAHHHQAYSKWSFLCAILRIPCKLFATHWLACGETAAIDGWGKRAVKNGRVMILPNAIDPERFKFSESARQEIRAKYGIAKDDFVIGHVGRFFPEKNHRFIIELFGQYSQNYEKCRLLLVGAGPLLAEIQQMSEQKNLKEKIVFAGLQKNIVDFYCAMDILLLPSIREAFPMTLIEAQYNGLPCIVSNAVPTEVAITDNMNSLPIDDIGPWCKQIRFSGVKQNRSMLQVNTNKFDIRICYKTLESIYQD